MNSLIPITVLVGDRTYRIKIEPGDEEVVRKSMKIINDKIIEFKTQFAGKDMQDYIGMVLLWFATEQIAAKGAKVETENIEDKLQVFEKLLDSHLQPGVM